MIMVATSNRRTARALVILHFLISSLASPRGYRGIALWTWIRIVLGSRGCQPQLGGVRDP